jgi:hypothetical protein
MVRGYAPFFQFLTSGEGQASNGDFYSIGDDDVKP